MKISVNHTIAYKKQIDMTTEIFKLSTSDSKVLSDHRQIKDIFIFISESFSFCSLDAYEKKETSNNLIIKYFKGKIEKPFECRIYFFDYMPTVSLYECKNCIFYSKDFCTIRWKYAKGKYKNCFYYIEKAKIKNLTIEEI